MHPTRRMTKFEFTAAAFGLALGAAVTAAAGPAHAADDGEWVDTKILRSILEGIGLRKDGEAAINYQERAPLVIPPRLDLPPPERKDQAANNPAWPKDPDVQRAKEEAAREGSQSMWASDRVREDARVLRPNELTPGARGGRGTQRQASRDDGYRASPNGYDSQMKPSELGYKGGLFGKMFGSKDDEVARFTGEPVRNELTDPPPGYQTPSPDQPYGLSKSTTNAAAKPGNYLENHVTPR